MESLQTLKSRLGAVKNIGQITKAMEVVSATKMRKAQGFALAGRPYAFEALRLLGTLVESASDIALSTVPLAERRPVEKTLIVVVVSDRGLAGSFNSQVFRTTDKFIESDSADSGSYQHVAVGKKSLQYFSRKGLSPVATFTGFGDYAKSAQVAPLAEFMIENFLSKRYDRVVTISTHFRSTLKQETIVREVLPLSIEKIRQVIREIVPEQGRFSELGRDLPSESSAKIPDYIFEPSPSEVLSSLLPELLSTQLLHLILEANASEHSARMVAMKAASDNAKDLSVGLQLEYNKARQAGITKEIIEITSTQAALG